MLIDTIKSNFTKTTEELLVELASRIAEDPTDQQLQQALGIVMLSHAGDNRRQIQAKYNHALHVALLAGQFAPDDREILYAALLHDVVEDYPQYLHTEKAQALTEVAQRFSPRVATIVDHLTNSDEVQQEEDEKHEVPQKYHEHIKEILADRDAATIKLADFCDNCYVMFQTTNSEFKRELHNRYEPVHTCFLAAIEHFDFASSDELEQYFDRVLTVA